MPAIGWQATGVAGHHIDGREIGYQPHGHAAGPGKAGKLDIQRIPAGHAEDAPPFPGMGGHERARFIAGQAHKITSFWDRDLRAIRSCIYPHEDFPAWHGGRGYLAGQ